MLCRLQIYTFHVKRSNFNFRRDKTHSADRRLVSKLGIG